MEEQSEMREGEIEYTGLRARRGSGEHWEKDELAGVRGERRYWRVGEDAFGFSPVL